jgi:predicted transcriptional regulator YheO
MENESNIPTIKEVESNGVFVMAHSVNDVAEVSFMEYTGDLTIYEYLGKKYKIVQWNENSKNTGKQFIKY